MSKLQRRVSVYKDFRLFQIHAKVQEMTHIPPRIFYTPEDKTLKENLKYFDYSLTIIDKVLLDVFWSRFDSDVNPRHLCRENSEEIAIGVIEDRDGLAYCKSCSLCLELPYKTVKFTTKIAGFKK